MDAVPTFCHVQSLLKTLGEASNVMGSLRDFDLAKLKERFRLKVLVETGTGEGHSLRYACEVGDWYALHSVDIDPAMTMVPPPGTVVWQGRSVDMLPLVLERIAGKGPALFWLDAHFPGNLSGAPLDAEANIKVRLPLQDELCLICYQRVLDSQLKSDVFIIDDAWIYRDGIAACGDWEERELVARGADDNFIRTYLQDTHVILQDPRANGYTIAVPKLAARYVLEDCLGDAAKKLREFR